ncbi:MAG TPA: hypothetical protein VMA13_08455 [Candidatus Saccharimonadales bacterium]|nr:hypothetical protein [Candidatus Saccharimonadales bacterium]
MNSRDIFKNIFALAVRLLGLVFLYFGLSAVPPLLDFGAIQTANTSDIINAILPIAFNLLIAWWLLGGGLLVRRAYPEVSRIVSPSPTPGETAVQQTKTTLPQRTPDLETAEKKLASLLAKPNDERAA